MIQRFVEGTAIEQASQRIGCRGFRQSFFERLSFADVSEHHDDLTGGALFVGAHDARLAFDPERSAILLAELHDERSLVALALLECRDILRDGGKVFRQDERVGTAADQDAAPSGPLVPVDPPKPNQ